MSVKVFTVREANRMIPVVSQTIVEIRSKAMEIIRLQDRIGVLVLIGGGDPSSPEHAEYGELGEELRTLVGQYNAHLEELQKIGCVLKDLSEGLVDFYGRKKNRLVFLCWKLGEKRISFWHEIDSGYTGRRPIRELQAEEEEGDA
jgi:hypothetical protein